MLSKERFAFIDRDPDKPASKMLPTFKVSIAFKQLKKDVLSNIVGIGTIAQIRQCDSKHDIPVIFNRLSKSLFFHNHLPVMLMFLAEALTIDTL